MATEANGSRSAQDGRSRAGRILHARPVLLIAFAFAVMGDPVSSVAYAIEAPLRALQGDLSLLLPTMVVVIGVVTLVIVNYHQLVGRFPKGGGAAAAAGAAFGEGWAFLPLGSLIVDFVLTIAISVAAGSSAIIAYVPGLAAYRLPLALALLVLVAGLTWFGHGGRAIFAAMTIAFVAICSVILLVGFIAPLNLARLYPIASLAAACAIAARLYWSWVRASRPTGVSEADRLAEVEIGEDVA